MKGGANRGRRAICLNAVLPGRSGRVVAYAYTNPTSVADAVDRTIIIKLLRIAAIQRLLCGAAK